MGDVQYVIKVKMKYTGTYSVGPFAEREMAENIADEIASGEMSRVKTQRGSTIYICGDPEIVEVLAFFPKREDR